MQQAQPITYLLHCEASKPQQDDEWQKTLFLVAARVTTLNGLNQKISEHLGEQGWQFIYAYQPQQTEEYLNDYPERQYAVNALCGQLDNNTHIALAHIKNDNILLAKVHHYVIIDTSEVPPLPEQDDKPFWEKRWISDELGELLFGAPASVQAQAASQPLNTYIVLDPNFYTPVNNGQFDLDTLDRFSAQCLFKGAAGEKNKTAAPWLLDISLNTLEDEHGNSPDIAKWQWLQRIFNPLWQMGALFIRSYADFNTLYNHLRRFIRFQNENGAASFFRFYDYRVAQTYFEGIKHCKQRVAKWYGIKDGHALIQAYIYRGNTPDTRFTARPDHRCDFPKASVQIRFDKGLDFEILLNNAKKQAINKLEPLILKEYGELNPLRDNQLHIFMMNQLSVAELFGLYSERAIGYFIASAFIRNQGYTYKELAKNQHFTDRTIKENTRCKALLETALTTHTV